MKKRVWLTLIVLLTFATALFAACKPTEEEPEVQAGTPSVTPANVTIYEGDAADKQFTVDLNNGTFVSVTNSSTASKAITVNDYTFSDGKLNLKGSYLSALAVGTHPYTLTASGGTCAFSVLVREVTVGEPQATLVGSSNVVTEGSATSVQYTVNLNHGEFLGVKLGDNALNAADYTFANGTLTFTAAYLNTLSAGSKTFTVMATGGECEVGVIINDKPVVTAKSMTKFPKESFTNESLSSNASDTVGGVKRYLIERPAVDGKGTFSCNENGTFSFAPEDGYYGTITFTFRAVDEYECISDPATVTILYKEIAPTFDMAQKSFIKGGAGDVVFQVNTRGTEDTSFTYGVLKVTYGEEVLGTDDYEYSAGTLIIKNSYLSGLEEGSYEYTLYTEAGSGSFTVVVSETVQAVVDFDAETKVAKTVELLKEVFSVAAIEDASHTIAEGDYETSGNSLTFKSEYLATLDYGVYGFKVAYIDSTEEEIWLVLNGKPVAGDNQNVTKFTSETITGEALRVAAKLNGTLRYTVKTQPDAGYTLTLNNNGTFDFARENGVWGTTGFTYTATDEYGYSLDVTMTVEFKPLNPTVADKDDKTYSLTAGADIVYTVTDDKGFDGLEITGNGITAEGYTLNGTTFTVKSGYLATLDCGTYEFTYKTAGGSETFTITVISGPTASVTQGFFDKNGGEDVTFTVDVHGAESVVLKKDGSELSGSDYTFAGGVLTVKKEYLTTLSTGEIGFVLSNGNDGDLELSIVISDTREPSIATTAYTFTVGAANHIKVNIELYGKTVTAVSVGENALTAADYEVNDGELTLNNSWLLTLSEGDTVVTVTFSDASSKDITISVSAAAPEISVETEDTFDSQNPQDIAFTVTGGKAYGAVSADDSYGLTENDYELNSDGGVVTGVTLKKNYLIRLHSLGLNEYAFTFKTADEEADVESSDGTDFTLAYDYAAYKIVNGGFESGTLFGWNSYSLWKGEEGMVAYTNDRVVSGKYFENQYEYNREGDYNLGIHGDYKDGNYQGISKDSGQERMGVLRSSNFKLGGSRVVSFMLGGGKSDAFAYVSVMRASDNAEIARVGNKNFNKAVDNVDNTEARLFRYYLDLSALAENTELYFLITDAASNAWCVLSADSFVTYYATAPSYGEDETANDILPTVSLAGSATNAIPQGTENNLDNMSNWTDVKETFKNDDGKLASNKNGDGDLGILRSPAFTLEQNKFLVFEWAGGLKHDKQIFVSVKEVGSNREVLRLVRRDNLGDKENSNVDAHWYDLSSLDGGKEYYLEFADNRDGSWGMFAVKSIELKENHGKADGDVAVQALGMKLYNLNTGHVEGEESNYFTYVAPSMTD